MTLATILALAISTSVDADSFTPLGYLLCSPSWCNSQAFGISGDGRVVTGTSSKTAATGNEAFRWDATAGLSGLGAIAGGADGGSGQALSADGTVIVGYGRGAAGLEAFRWTSNTGMVGLGVLPGGPSSQGFANDVSADGSIIVGQSSSAPGSQAVMWTAAGMVPLGDLPGGGFRSGASALSADGAVVVGSGTPDGSESEAFRWTATTGMVGLGFLAGATFSTTTGTSSDGSVVTGWSGTSLGNERAFIWTAADGMVSLGDLPGGEVQSQAHAIAANAMVVVGSSSWSEPMGLVRQEAFVWMESGGMQRLFDVLLAGGATGLEGWRLIDATAISADGATVVGYANDPQNGLQAFVATLTPVPAPGAALLLGTAIASLAVARRGRHRSVRTFVSRQRAS